MHGSARFHNQSYYNWKVHSVLNTFSSELWELCTRDKRSVQATEDEWHKGDSAFQTQQDRHTYELRDSGRHRACTGLSQIGSQCWKGKLIRGLIPTQAMSNWQQYAKEKKIFSKGVSLSIQTTLKAPCPVVGGQQKQLGGGFVDFGTYCFVWTFFFSNLSGLLIVYYGFPI